MNNFGLDDNMLKCPWEILRRYVNTTEAVKFEQKISNGTNTLSSAPKIHPPSTNPPQHHRNSNAARHTPSSNDSILLLERLVHLRLGQFSLVRVVVALLFAIGAEDAGVDLLVNQE
jgi:hypothetical protein